MRPRPSTGGQVAPPARAGGGIVVVVNVDLPGLRLRPELLAAGLSDDDLARLHRSGGLERVRRGAYVDGTDERLRLRGSRHALAARAAVTQLPPGAVVSHVSAAVLHGLPAWGMALDRVHVTRDGLSGGHRHPNLHVHVTPLRPDEITAVDGLPVTTVARTLADLARDEPFPQAVAVTDAGLRRGAVTRDALDDAVDRVRGRPGVRAARRVAAFADARSEGVGQSRSRVLLDRARLPPPVLAWEVPARRPVGCADFAWPELRTVGEFRRDRIGHGRGPGDAVVAEKWREDAIRDAGFQLVRWVWADLDDFDDVVARLYAAFARARGSPGIAWRP